MIRTDLTNDYFTSRRSKDIERLERIDQEIRSLLKSPTQGLAVVGALVEATESDEEVAYVAAGPLEDLLGLHAESIESDLLVAARKSATMRKALTGVWASEGSSARNVLNRILDKLSLRYGSL